MVHCNCFTWEHQCVIQTVTALNCSSFYRFDPERFSPENRKEIPPYGFQPFGFAGKRKCPAYRFSYAEGTVFLSVLLRKFKIRMVPGQTVIKDYGFVTRPKEEIWITVEPRK